MTISTQQFSVNWFGHQLDVWKKYLGEYAGRENLHYLEIGVFEGRSCLWVWQNILTHGTCRATVVDPFHLSDREEKFRANLAAAGYSDRTTVHVANSQEILRTMPLESVDILYIDGSHLARDIMHDAILGWDLLRRGGLMIFDDYQWIHPDSFEESPKFAIDAFIRLHQQHLVVLHIGYKVFLLKESNAWKSRSLY